MQGLERSRTANRLTALEVKKASGPGVLEDGAGLRLFINEAGQKHWIVRVTINGKRVARGLGSFPAVSLQAARDHADVIRKAAREGRDAAIEIKQEQRRHVLTFREACRRYFEEVKRPTLKPGRFAERWIDSLDIYAHPKLEPRPVADITPSEIIEVLQPIWHQKRETATRILQRMTVVFQSAIVRGDRVHANPCQGVRDELGRARPKVQHRRALAYAEVPAFAFAARSHSGNGGFPARAPFPNLHGLPKRGSARHALARDQSRSPGMDGPRRPHEDETGAHRP